MSIELAMPDLKELKPNITVIGVGGAGGNAVNNMIRSELHGVEFVAMNTDAQALSHSLADRKMQLGVKITQGLGAGSQPDIGRAAAEENIDAIEDALAGCHMAFITAGMGGGTGTGASPIVAQLAKEKGILTVAVVTKPFHFEGGRRMALADAGIQELQNHVDTLIIIPNQNLFRVANEKTTFADAFGLADQVLHSGVRGVTDLMVMPGLINLDFADVRAVMHGMGQAMMGTGEADGENRAVEAAEAAISNPLLDDVSMRGARGVIINITGGMDLTLFEVDEAANHIRSQVDPEANIIVGSAFSEDLNGQMRVSVVATGVQIEARHEDDQRMMKSVQMLTETGAVRANPRPAVVTSAETAAVMMRDDASDEDADTPSDDDNYEEELPPAAATEASEEGSEDPEEESAPEPAAAVAMSSEQADETDDIEDRLGDDVFVSPAARMPEEAPAASEEPEPFAAAAMANGTRPVDDVSEAEKEVAEAPPPAREERIPSGHASLFERMTGAFRAGEKATAAVEDEDEEEREPAFPAVTTIDTEGLDRPAYRREAQPSEIGRIGPDDRAVPEGELDQLEIPAFLRRQVN